MDELDQKLLSELQNTGFQRSAVLGARLGIGDRTVRRRIGAMKNRGVIKIIAMTKPMAPGWRVWAKIGIKVEPGSSLSIAQTLIEHPSIYFVAHSLGQFDIMIAVRFDTMNELTYFANSELTMVKGILYTDVMLLVHPRKYYNYSWPKGVFENNQGEESCRNATTNYEVDDIDRQIISVLSEDALTPVRVLKDRLGIGDGTIRKRITKMLNREVFKIEVVHNPHSLDYDVWATMGLTIINHSTDEVINTIIKNPAVYLSATSLGRFNIIISVRFHNLDLLNEFVNSELAMIKGVTAIEVFLHTRPVKYHNIKW